MRGCLEKSFSLNISYKHSIVEKIIKLILHQRLDLTGKYTLQEKSPIQRLFIFIKLKRRPQVIPPTKV